MQTIESNLSVDFDFIELFPLSDLHVGDALSDSKLFYDFVQFILAEPYRYLMGLGDLINNNLKHSAGSTYEDIMSPGQQKKEIVRFLMPVRDRLLGMVGGNHEGRTKKEVDLDITEEVADKLGVPFREEEALWVIRFGNRRPSDKTKVRPYVYTVYGTHGSWGGKRPGSAINNAEDLSRGMLCDVYVAGHAHKRIGHRATIRIPDTRNGKVTEMEQLYVCASSWLKYGGYGARKSYRPQVRGTAPVVLGRGPGQDQKEMYAVI